MQLQICMEWCSHRKNTDKLKTRAEAMTQRLDYHSKDAAPICMEWCSHRKDLYGMAFSNLASPLAQLSNSNLGSIHSKDNHLRVQAQLPSRYLPTHNTTLSRWGTSEIRIGRYDPFMLLYDLLCDDFYDTYHRDYKFPTWTVSFCIDLITTKFISILWISVPYYGLP